MRRFRLDRHKDETGVSGTGCVAQGVIFYDGTVALRWLTEHKSTALYASLAELEAIHLHGGASSLRFEDPICFACGVTLTHDEWNGKHCLACGAGQADEKGEVYFGARPNPSMGGWHKALTLNPREGES